jgi:hypothetical protein
MARLRFADDDFFHASQFAAAEYHICKRLSLPHAAADHRDNCRAQQQAGHAVAGANVDRPVDTSRQRRV